MRFIVIRHGQSTNNLLWQTTGSEAGRNPDTPLTPIGHDQAHRLADAVADGVLPWKIDVLYASLMLRAVQTAAPLAEALDLPLRGHARLHEVGGPYDLDDATGAMSPNPGSGSEVLQAASGRLVLPEGAGVNGWYHGEVEPLSAVGSRVEQVVSELRASHDDDQTVALVCHGYLSQFLFRHFLRIRQMTGWLEIHNTSLTLYEDRPEPAGVRSVRTDWLPHLPPELVTT